MFLGITISSIPLSHAQQTTTTTNAPTNFTKLFSENKEFQQCLELSTVTLPCVPSVDVLYEDPTTVVPKIVIYRYNLESGIGG